MFEELRDRISPALRDVAERVEHVGSTSVPGLAAKPVIDMTVVVPDADAVSSAIGRLAAIGYAHRGDLGIAGREAFTPPPGLPAHNLHVCPSGNLALRNHLAVRDYLRGHPDAARAYGDLKKHLAGEFRNDIDGYVDGKTDFILGILRAQGLGPGDLDAIGEANRKPAGGSIDEAPPQSVG
jgi:GrpB-like predicted nucleotidyltransferase (UPF0157 family)